MKPLAYNYRRMAVPVAASKNNTTIDRIFGDGRFAYDRKGRAYERVVDMSKVELDKHSGPQHKAAMGYQWVEADTQSPDYLAALSTIPTCPECGAVVWNQGVPCRSCEISALPEWQDPCAFGYE